MTPLDHLSILAISGPDARKFLQGQATCDVELCNESSSIPGGLCNPKGRLYASFLLGCHGNDTLLLRMRGDILASTAANLGKYIVFSRAELADCSDGYRIVGLTGPGCSDRLAAFFDPFPGHRYQSVNIGADTIIQLDDEGTRFECWIDQSTEASALAAILEDCTPGRADDWLSADIATGDTQIEAATVDLFLPQMLNYQITGHISFTKGCYTGQEVVSRMHYRGKTKRRVFVAAVEALNSAEGLASKPLYVQGKQQSVGNIANAAAAPRGGIAVLAVITAALANIETVSIGEPVGSVLALGTLPYEVPD